jgi:hypothetical protein
MSSGQVVEDQIGAAVGDFVQQGHQEKANRIARIAKIAGIENPAPSAKSAESMRHPLILSKINYR